MHISITYFNMIAFYADTAAMILMIFEMYLLIETMLTMTMKVIQL